MRNRQADLTYPTLAVAIALSAAVTLLHNHALHNGRVDALTSRLRSYVVAPTVRSEQSGIAWTASSLVGSFQAAKTARENAFLRAKLGRVIVENQLLRQQVLADNLMRKSLHGVSATMPDLIVGNVIALKPSQARDNALVEVASGHILHERQVVLDSNGALVGQVVDSDHAVADVMLITDNLSSVGARVVANGRPASAKVVVGICEGNRGATLAFVDLPSGSDVRAGDSVVTSGLGGVYPAGIPLGRLTSVRVDAARSMMTATVDPATDSNNLQEVFLLP